MMSYSSGANLKDAWTQDILGSVKCSLMLKKLETCTIFCKIKTLGGLILMNFWSPVDFMKSKFRKSAFHETQAPRSWKRFRVHRESYPKFRYPARGIFETTWECLHDAQYLGRESNISWNSVQKQLRELVHKWNGLCATSSPETLFEHCHMSQMHANVFMGLIQNGPKQNISI